MSSRFFDGWIIILYMYEGLAKTIGRTNRSLRNFLLPGAGNGLRAGIFSGNFLVYFLIALIAFKTGVAVFFGFFPKSDFFADITKSAIVSLANDDRRQAGLSPLTENPVLERAALMKAQDMLSRGYFEHTSPQGLSPWYWFSRSGYDYRFAGENLAIGFIESGEVNSAWLASPTHKANIMNNNYRETGIAVVNGRFQGSPTTIVVQLFGTKMPVKAGTLAKPAPKERAVVVEKTAPTTDQKAPAALAALNSQTLSESVLGASDIEAATRAVQNAPDTLALPYRVTSFLANGYFTLAQRIMYSALFFVIILLAVNFALRADFNHRDLLFKAVGFLVLAALFLAMDRQMILMLVPHLPFIS
jgi:hypothetical protein